MRYRFEGFEVLEQERQLRIGGLRVGVGGRSFDVLLALVEHHDRVVTKSELLDRVWSGQFVEEGNLQVQISNLRKVLGQHVIATVPGRGYRLTMRPLEEFAGDADGHTRAATEVPKHVAFGPRRTNLPDRLPALYGRDADLARIHDLLGRHSILSLVAAGGVGKTHLARALAGTWREALPDGVWCIELAQLQQAEFVAPEVASVLGFQVPAGRSAIETVVDVLRRQRALLLLDNCEHLLPAVAELVTAIHAAATQVRMLITSQQPVKVAGEHVYRLDPLALPETSGLDAARHSGAVQLLVHRVQAVAPKFELTLANADRVVALCRQLDGIPLALEFAAARVPVLGLDGLLARLNERFRVLTGPKSGLQRYQTLRGALEFSHGLLSADEQTVLRRIGVFAGSFSADAAQEVAVDATIDHWAVLDHLGALVDKSLLLAEGDEPPRLRLLETTRLYALERLAEAGEYAAWHERHARATAAIMARAADDYWVLTDAELRERYGAEHANLRAALGWALQHDAELAIEMAGNACALWRESWSQQPEGARFCEAALALVSKHTPPLAAGRLNYALGWMLIWSKQQRGRAAALRAAQLLRQTEDRATLSMTLLLLIPGTTPLDSHQHRVLEELQALYDPNAPPRVQAACISAFARFAMGGRRWDEASGLYTQARTLLARCGAVQWEAVLAWTMAGIALGRGGFEFASVTLRETALRLQGEPTHGIFLAFCLGSLATAELLLGDVTAANAAFTSAAPLIVRFELGFRYGGTAAWLAAAQGRWQAAAQLLGFCGAIVKAAGVDAEEPVEIVARQRAMALLAEQADAASISAATNAGAMLSTEAAYELALARGDDSDMLAPAPSAEDKRGCVRELRVRET